MDRGAPGVVLERLFEIDHGIVKAAGGSRGPGLLQDPLADLGTRDQAMAITPTTATTENTPERMSSGFQRTVIGLYSFGSSCRAARHGRLRAAGPSGPSGGPSIRGVENRQEILGNDHGNHVRKVRERPGT